MTVDQELLSNTKHVQEQKGAITLVLFGPPRDTSTTTKSWRYALMPPWASRHIGGSRQGHPRYTDARKGRPSVAHNTIHSATTVLNQKTGTTVFNNVQCLCFCFCLCFCLCFCFCFCFECMCMCTCVYVYVYMFVYVSVSVNVNVNVNVYVYLYLYVYVYVYVVAFV